MLAEGIHPSIYTITGQCSGRKVRLVSKRDHFDLLFTTNRENGSCRRCDIVHCEESECRLDVNFSLFLSAPVSNSQSSYRFIGRNREKNIQRNEVTLLCNFQQGIPQMVLAVFYIAIRGVILVVFPAIFPEIIIQKYFFSRQT